MPQLNINVPPELWHAIEAQGDQQGDGPVGIVFRALSEYLDGGRDRLYQVSTSSALVEGVSDGAVEIGTLRKYGDHWSASGHRNTPKHSVFRGTTCTS